MIRWISWCLIFLPIVALGQSAKNDTPLKVVLSGIISEKTTKKLQLEMVEAGDTASAILYIKNWCSAQQTFGYPECGLSSVKWADSTLRVEVHQGPQYLLQSLTLEGLEPHIRQRIGTFSPKSKSSPLNWEALADHLAMYLRYYQNRGYPFARFFEMGVDYEKLSHTEIGAHVQYTFDYGPYVTIDSIYVVGNKREKDAFVWSLARLEPGMPYNQQLIDDIPRQLNNSIYYEQVKPPKVSFTVEGKAHITIEVKQKKAGKFDLLLGLLPPDQPGTNQRLRVTGLVDLVFVSPFQGGEILALTYNRLNALSQFFDLAYTQPNMLGTMVELEGRFKLENRDSSFINRLLIVGASYPLSPHLDAQVYWRSKSTDLLDARPYANDTLIPPILSGANTIFGVGFAYERLDYRLNPRKGLALSVDAGLGRRTVVEDRRLQPVIFEKIPPSQPSTELSLAVEAYIPTFKRQTLRLANKSYWLGQDQYFRNDQPQLGGGKSIRGFNENQFFVDRYTFFSAEYRLLLDRNSHIFVFTDFALLKNTVAAQTSSPLGLGFGLTFDTKSAGILSLIYGVGTVNDLPLQPSRGKLHIGLINRF